MVLVARLSRFLVRNIRPSAVASVRHYDPETAGTEIKSTTVTMLNKEDDDYLYVEAYSQVGFKLSNGFRIIGPCVLFPRSILHWGIGGTHELNDESLSLFPLLDPKLDILILGVGDHGAKYDKNVFKFLRSKKINVEILPTDQACATFNFLNAERRMVAAALIPPTYMHLENDEDLEFRTQLEANQDPFELKRGYGESAYDDEPGEFAELRDTAQKKIYPKFGIHVKEGQRKGEEFKTVGGGSKSKDSGLETGEKKDGGAEVGEKKDGGSETNGKKGS